MGTVGLSLEDYEATREGVGVGVYAPTRGVSLKKELTPELPVEPGIWEGVSEEEKAFATAHPTVHAAGKVAWDFLGAIERVGKAALPQSPEEWAEQGRNIEAFSQTITGHLPFVKYALPEKREELLKLNQWEQTQALLWDTFETELLLFPTQVLKGVFKAAALPFKGVRRGYKALRPGFKFEPIESLSLKVKPFFAEEHMVRNLKKAGFANDELAAVIDESPRGLRHFFFQKTAAKGEVSKALRKAVRWQRGGARLSRETRELLDVSKLRAKHYRKEWNKVVGKRLGKEFSPARAEAIFDAQVGTLMGKEWVGKVTLKGANDYQMGNFLRHVLTHTRALEKAAVKGSYNRVMFDSISPVRVVLGSWEQRFGTYRNVYQVVIPALEKRNKYCFDKLTVIAQMFKERGLGVWKVSKRRKLKLDPVFSEKEAKSAYDAMIEIDNLRSLQKRMPIKTREIADRIKGVLKGLPENSRKLIKTKNDFYNALWAEHAHTKIPQILRGAGLTAKGKRAVDSIEASLLPFLDEAFSTGSKMNAGQKVLAAKGMLRELRRPLVFEGERHPWFLAEGKQLEDLLGRLTKEFTSTQKGGNFIGFLEDYIPRIAASRNSKYNRWDQILVGRMRSFYTKERKSPFAFDLITDLGRSFEGRVRAQANDLYLYPAIEKAVGHTKNLPYKIREYVDHWLARALGRQSFRDEQVAAWFRKVVPFGKKAWTEEKIAQLARRANDLAILGGLGFKPFSAMRNLFQPLLTIPAEMGGIQGFEHLLHGYKRAFDPKFRKWVRDNGMIQEFAPEIYFTQRLLPWGPQAKWDQVRDVALWMYSGADRANRYVSAGAAVHKWEKALGTVGVTKPGVWNHAKFMKKSGGSAHYSWARDEIDDLVRAGRLEEAKLVHAKDVVANTQFLYRPAESPIISQKWGAAGKTGFLFQSWWANYGTLLEKWMRTGDVGAKANRMFTWMISSAIAYQCMEGLWGRGMAERSVFLGPFPTTAGKEWLPATWAPIYEALNLLKSGMSPDVWAGDTDRLVRHAKALLKQSAIMFPGGLQIKTMARAVAKEGVRGLPASIIRYQKAKRGEWPLWGALE